MATKQITAPGIRQTLARQKYWEYVKYVFQGLWKKALYLIYVCDTVQSFLEDTFINPDTGKPYQVLCISMPPQHGKSMSLTETLPSWFLGKWPYKRVIEVSYAEDFARKFGRRNREKVSRFGYELFGIRLSRNTQSMTEWELDNGFGSMLSRGLGGPITGNPADLIIIDDPVKNRQEAESEVYRERVWDEYLNSLRTRLSATGKIIIIMTRWHEDDLIARALKEEGPRAYYLNLPCEAEEDDPVLREPGEPLGEILGKGYEWLADFKPVYMSQKGSRVWNSLYQGRPTAAEGNLFKRQWLRYYTTAPEHYDEEIQSWDCTFKDSDGTDFVAGQVWRRVGADYYMMKRYKDRLDLPGTCAAISVMTEAHPRSLLKLVEDKANGPAVIQVMQTLIPGLVPVDPEGGKIARAHAVSPAWESGNVYIPDPIVDPGIVDYVSELMAFPNGANDDEVDATTQALNRLIYYKDHREPAQPPPKDHEEALHRRVNAHLENLIKERKKGRGVKQL